MKIIYKSLTVEKQFSSKYKKNWRYPQQVKRKLEAAENFIESADSLQDLVEFPVYHFHALKGNRKGEWSIYLGHTGYRVVLIPCNQDGNEILDGDIISQCKIIKIVKIMEVSNHYE